MHRILKGALMLGAPPTWSASFVPMTVGYASAFLLGGVPFSLKSVFWMLLSFAAMALIETGKHAVNDLVDFQTGNDPAVDAQHITPFSGGKKALTSGVLSEKEAVFVGLATFCGAGALGLFIVWFQSAAVLWFGIAGILISILYTLPPVMLCYRGLGELAIFITYGPLILLGAYFVFASEHVVLLLAMSVHIGCLITNVLVINEYPDYEADLAARKMNLLARIGKEKGNKWYLGLFLLSYLPIVFLVVYTGRFIWLITLLLLPLMWKGYKNCKANYDDIKQLVFSNRLTIKIHMLSGLLLIVCLMAIG